MDRSALNHLALFDVESLFAASKHRDFRSRTLMRAQATAEVFTRLGISNVDLASRFHACPEQFRVLIGDLTEAGLAFARVHYQRWLSNSDRWKEPATLDKFEQTLVAQWNKFNGSGA